MSGQHINVKGTEMTPQQKLKWAILAQVAQWEKREVPEYPCDNVDDLYESLVEEYGHGDAKNEIRCGEVETKIGCDFSRHYESKAVAMKMPDGTWIGWTYWYGGGKYGEPEAIDWMEDAYEINCHEEEKVVIVQTFTRAEP